ncbi:hypothetical protein GF324_01125, partial [bacterium]|nr:hypothetical protein [bacterium]
IDNSRAAAAVRRLSGRWGPAKVLFDPAVAKEALDLEEFFSRLESAVTSYGGPEGWAAAFGGHDTVRRDVTRILVYGGRLLSEANSRPYLWERIGHSTLTDAVPPAGDAKRWGIHIGNALFHYGVSFLSGELGAMDLTASWTGEIDAAVQALAGDLTAQDPAIGVIALGKWGGGELAPDADLDLMFVAPPCDYAALARAQQRAVNWMLKIDPGGRLQLDARLRPEGSGAPMVSTLPRIRDYLAGRADPWEKIALVRARAVAGNMEIAREAVEVLQQFTTQPPTTEKQWAALHRARKRAAKETSKGSRLLNIKKGRGGMMDFEFATTFAAWSLKLPPGPEWSRPLPERMRIIANASGDERWQKAAVFYSELRRWELSNIIAGGRKAAEMANDGGEGETTAKRIGMTPETVQEKWNDTAAVALDLYHSFARIVHE